MVVEWQSTEYTAGSNKSAYVSEWVSEWVGITWKAKEKQTGLSEKTSNNTQK